jgi:hypothetical protein
LFAFPPGFLWCKAAENSANLVVRAYPLLLIPYSQSTIETPMPPLVYAPGLKAKTVIAPGGQVLPVPEGWVFLQPGDAALTRRVKLAGDHWIVQEKKGRKTFTRGLWAPEATILQIQADLTTERATEGYAKKKAAGVKRREKVQEQYVEDFTGAIVTFLNFHPRYAELAQRFALAVSAHATPVGSGTVARTQRIPIERRAEAAVIAWMRHQTTAYDSMSILHIKGERREVRQQLAKRSRELLTLYRQGLDSAPSCPLHKALSESA